MADFQNNRKKAKFIYRKGNDPVKGKIKNPILL